jgi:hypothetical protein
MGWWSTVRSVAEVFGLPAERVEPIGCELGQRVYRETKRAAVIVNLNRRARPLQAATVARLQPLYPDTDLGTVRVRTRCRLPANRFAEGGSIYAMTFGSTIFFRDELDEHDPGDLVSLMHELIHVDQARRFGGETGFSCEYGRGYLRGGGDLPAYIDDVTDYHRNPLEAEAYTFESRFRDARGRVVSSSLPAG